MQIHLIISNTIRYDFVEQLATGYNTTRYYVNKDIRAPSSKGFGDNYGSLEYISGRGGNAGFEVDKNDCGVLVHTEIDFRESILDAERKYGDKIEDVLSCLNMEDQLKFCKDNCHLVISVTNATHVPDCLMELIDNVYIFQQKTISSIEAIHNNFTHHCFADVLATKQYLLTNLKSKDWYIACSGYPYTVEVYQLEKK